MITDRQLQIIFRKAKVALLFKWLVFDLTGLTQNLAYVGIVHVRESLEDLAPLVLCPHHECVHWPFNVGLVVVPSAGFPEDSCLCRSSASCWPTIIGLGFICRAIYFPGPCNSQSSNRKRERGKTLSKWRAMLKLSLLIISLVSGEHMSAEPPKGGSLTIEWKTILDTLIIYVL